MGKSKDRSQDDQLDALIAKIHGLTGQVESPQEEFTEEFVSPKAIKDGSEDAFQEARQAVETDPEAIASASAPSRPAPSRPSQPGPVAGTTGGAADSRLSSPASSPRPASTLHPGGGRSTSQNESAPAQIFSVPGAESHGAADEKTLAAARQHAAENQQDSGAPLSALLFTPSQDEPWRPDEPTSFDEVGVSESLVEQILLRFLLARGETSGRRMAAQVKLPFRLIEPMLERLKTDQTIAYRRGSTAGDYIYALTEAGRAIARGMANDCTYYGACPVPLEDYIRSVRAQTVEGQHPRQDDLHRAFSDLLIDQRMLERLGPAINSGRGMFLYGFPGNGKTSIAERVTASFGKYVWVPRAVEVEGEIMRVFDQMNHEVAMPEDVSGLLDQSGFDKRWVRIKRPTIVAGGELTMDMLEVQGNSETNISEAPLQIKSNCGTLVIDDFGRQKMSVDTLLNRWIVPLEKRYDFLNMRSGKKIQVPFDQLIVFSTNLEPKDLVDDAFLRRIPYKIEVPDPAEVHFRELFEIMCRVLKMPYDPAPIDYLIKTHYLPVNRPFRNCQPRDLLLQVRNYCLYLDRPVELRNEYFDYAVDNYFSIM